MTKITGIPRYAFHALLAIVLTAAASVLATAPASAGAKGFDRIHHNLLRHDAHAPLMIASHRGLWREAPENSLGAIDRAVKEHAEIVEIDVHATADGELVLMHDDTVDRTTNGSGRVADLTLAQIKSLRLKEGLGGAQAPLTDATVPTLEEAMRTVKGRALVNLDKGWPLRDAIYQVLRETGTVDHGIFKGSPTVEEAAAFMAKDPDILYMHVIDDGTATQVEFPGRQPVGYEVIFDSTADPQVRPATLAKIRETGRVWINTLWNGLATTYTDEASLRDENLGWATVVGTYGANVIQTDNIDALDYWRHGGDLDRYGLLPGHRSIRVQAEDYAPGGEGVGYHDTDGNRCDVARPEEGVDICDQDGAIAVNWIRGGEWLKYTVDIRVPGRYQISGRVSSPYSPAGTVVLDWGSATSGPIAIRNTTEHRAFETQAWETRYLTAGSHEFVVRMDENAFQNFNIDHVQFDRTGH